MAKKVNKERKQLITTVLFFWIVVFMIYAAIFGPLIKDVKTWLLWVKIVVLVLVILLPLVGQGLLIYNHHVKKTTVKK